MEEIGPITNLVVSALDLTFRNYMKVM